MMFGRTADGRLTVTFRDTFELDEFTTKPCNGGGGGQRFVQGMQKCFRFYVSQRPRLSFELSHGQTEEWIRTTTAYGGGGFQGHLGKRALEAFLAQEAKEGV